MMPPTLRYLEATSYISEPRHFPGRHVHNILYGLSQALDCPSGSDVLVATQKLSYVKRAKSSILKSVT